MSYLSTTDYNLNVLRGKVNGHSMVSIIGHDDNLTTTQTTVHPTGITANIDQSAIDATPALVKVASTNTNDTSAGSGLQTVTVIGLDASGVAQSEAVSMNGQTEVATANTYSAVNGLRAATWGANNKNAGTVWVGTGSFSSGVPAVRICSMHVGHNRAMTAYYVVPAGYTLYFRQLTIQLGSSNKDVEIFIEQGSNGAAFFTEAIFEIESGSEFQGRIIAVPGIVAGQHVRTEAVSSNSGTKLTTILGCELVAN